MKRKWKYKRVLGVVLSLVVFLGGVAVIKNVLDNQNIDTQDDPVVKIEAKQEKKPETQKEQTFKSPVNENIGVVRYFYDKKDDIAKQEQSLILFEGVYRPNQGIDYSNKNEPFEVKAAMDGTVTKKTNDPVLGWVVTIVHDNKISTSYQALSNVKVEANQTVKQGDIIGMSGENIYEADLKNHLHFILQKDDQLLNPEKYINKPLSQIK